MSIEFEHKPEFEGPGFEVIRGGEKIMGNPMTEQITPGEAERRKAKYMQLADLEDGHCITAGDGNVDFKGGGQSGQKSPEYLEPHQKGVGPKFTFAERLRGAVSLGEITEATANHITDLFEVSIEGSAGIPAHVETGIPGADLAPETADLVRIFAAAFADKLLAAQIKYGYGTSWMGSDWMDDCRRHLVEHLRKGDPRDVAAYCAFLWHHGEPTCKQPLQAPVAEKSSVVPRGWQPIDTTAPISRWIPVGERLPESCVAVLTIHIDDLYPSLAFRSAGQDSEWIREFEGPEDTPNPMPGRWEPLLRAPTHWQPLPEPPVEAVFKPDEPKDYSEREVEPIDADEEGGER